MKSNALLKLTEQEIDAFANIDLDMPSSRLALGAIDLSHATIIVITIRIMAIAVLSNLVHSIVRRS